MFSLTKLFDQLFHIILNYIYIYIYIYVSVGHAVLCGFVTIKPHTALHHAM